MRTCKKSKKSSTTPQRSSHPSSIVRHIFGPIYLVGLLCCDHCNRDLERMIMQSQTTLRLGRVGASALLRSRIAVGIRQQPTTKLVNCKAQCAHPSCCCRTFSSSADLPYHIVMGLPALSPTMESGALAEWYVKEGDRFAAGDAVAKIETDKASIDFEAQDDGFVAKILATAGDGKDIMIGTPIMISVEEEEHVAAFANYVSPATTTAAPAAPVVVAPSAPPPKAAAAAPVAAVAPPVVAAATPPPHLPPPAAASPALVVAPAASIPAVTAVGTPTAAAAAYMNIATAWGSTTAVKSSSPLTKTLEANHLAYVEKYGTTGQTPSV
jgi:Biotin-requiring enzyme